MASRTKQDEYVIREAKKILAKIDSLSMDCEIEMRNKQGYRGSSYERLYYQILEKSYYALEKLSAEWGRQIPKS